MGKVKNIVIGSAVVFIGFIAIETALAQDNPKSGAQTQREMQKKKWIMARKAKQSRDSALKAHMKHQTRAVRKRMKKDYKKANITNQGGDY